jgi:hypothetical protein
MNHCRLLFLTCYFLLFATVTSQAQSINGAVTGCADKQPLAGVTVKIADKSLGTATGNEDLEHGAVGLKAADKTFRRVRGLTEADVIGSSGKKATANNGVIYLSVSMTDESRQAVYCIDPVMATASKGMIVSCSSIGAAGKLSISTQ